MDINQQDLLFCCIVALIFASLAIMYHNNIGIGVFIVVFLIYLVFIGIALILSRLILGYSHSSVYCYILSFVLFIILSIIIGMLLNSC